MRDGDEHDYGMIMGVGKENMNDKRRNGKLCEN